jgi:hypothetical protein
MGNAAMPALVLLAKTLRLPGVYVQWGRAVYDLFDSIANVETAASHKDDLRRTEWRRRENSKFGKIVKALKDVTFSDPLLKELSLKHVYTHMALYHLVDMRWHLAEKDIDLRDITMQPVEALHKTIVHYYNTLPFDSRIASTRGDVSMEYVEDLMVTYTVNSLDELLEEEGASTSGAKVDKAVRLAEIKLFTDERERNMRTPNFDWKNDPFVRTMALVAKHGNAAIVDEAESASTTELNSAKAERDTRAAKRRKKANPLGNNN